MARGVRSIISGISGRASRSPMAAPSADTAFGRLRLSEPPVLQTQGFGIEIRHAFNIENGQVSDMTREFMEGTAAKFDDHQTGKVDAFRQIEDQH